MGSPNAAGKEGSASGAGGSSSSGGLPESNSSVYTEGEKVLAYHGPLIYQAKVQKAEIRKKEWRYFVHYLGWNKNWDEWVGAERLLKYSSENIQKQQALAKQPGSEKNLKSGRSAQAKPKVSNEAKVEKEETKNNVTKGKKRKVDSGAEKEGSNFEKSFKIQMPISLRKQLIDDWGFVNQQDKLVKLPRSPNVDEIFRKYLDYRSKKDGPMTDSVAEVLNGLRSYFDKALPMMLLYKKERQQHHEVLKDDASPSSIYGAEHLLRLFVKLPEILSCLNIEEETWTTLQQKLLDFLKYLQRNQNAFFPSACSSGSKGAGGTTKGKAG